MIIIIRENAYNSKELRKKKNRQKPVKAPLWLSPFLRLHGSQHTFVKIHMGDSVSTDKTAFTKKRVVSQKWIDFILNLLKMIYNKFVVKS